MKIAVDDPLYDDLRRIEKLIKDGEGDRVLNRWEFGHALLQRRVGKQLPKGVVASVVKEHGLSRSEIHRRMQLAETFASKDEVSHAWDTFGSWRRIVSEALPKREAADRARPAWDERMHRRIERIIDDAETEDQLKTLAELLHKAIERLESSQEVAA
jgi:hypothetical protein